MNEDLKGLKVLYMISLKCGYYGDSGGLRRLFHSYIEGAKLIGCQVSLYSSWDTVGRCDYDLVHMAPADPSMLGVARLLHEIRVPYVISPILDKPYSRLLVRSVTAFSSIMRRLWTSHLGAAQEICMMSSAICAMSNDEIKMVQHGLGVNGPPIGIIRPAKECIMPDALIDRSNVVSDVGEYVLFVGDLANERKNALPLIEACEKAKYPLAMIGSLNKTAYGSRVLSAINNSQYTKYYGMLNARVDVLAAMRHCRVFALPSITEGIGIAALEAGILGARVVATCNGGIREYLGTNAWYVNPESCISIYKGIVSAWTATHRPPLNQHIADNLTLRNTAKSMIDLYSRALRR